MNSNKKQPELGIGENEDFLERDNQLFINKLNYICKNYDTSFKDVSFQIYSPGTSFSRCFEFMNVI